MKYHSRSPEEWRKIDEEKMKTSRTSELRKRSLMFLFVNFVMVIAVILMVRIYQIVSPASKNSVGPFRIYITVDEEFLEGEPVEAQVKIVNTRKSEQDLEIEGFSFKIEGDEGTEYSFEHPDPVSAKLEPLSYVLVFDLSRESKLDDLKPGLHKVVVSMKVNGIEKTVVRSFKVVERFEIDVLGYQPFLIVGESLSVDIGIFNPMGVMKKVEVDSVEVLLRSESGERLDERRFKLGRTLEIHPGDLVSLVNYSPGLVFNTPGIFQMDVSVDVGSKTLKRGFGFSVITKDQEDIRGVRVYVEVPIQVVVGKPFDLKVSLYNDTEENRYVEVSSMFVSLGEGEIVLSEKREGFRVWIPPNSKETVYEKSGITVRNPGKYELLILFRTPQGDISKRVEVMAGGV